MLAIERRSEILATLQQEKRVVVSDLSRIYNVTEETIRRDLDKLTKEGLIKKTYGGAVINESLNADLSYNVRKESNILNKQHIARLVCAMIEDGEHIMLDASSTALYIARYLKTKKNITLITNSIEILLDLSDMTGWKVLSTGGLLKEGSLSLVGHQTERMLKTFHMDKAIISCKGLDINSGFTDSNELDAQIKKIMLNAAKQKILAVDSTKFDKIAFTNIGRFCDVDIIVTDKEPDYRWKQVFKSAGIKIYYDKD